MADMLISPQPYTTQGGVPRRLLAGVFLVVVLTAMGVFLATAKDEPLPTGDQKARAELMKPEAVTALAKGQESSVDDAAERARSDVERADKARVLLADAARRLAASAVSAPHDAMAQLPESTTAASLREHAAGLHSGQGEADAAAAERERASRSAASTVFDESGTSAFDAAIDPASGSIGHGAAGGKRRGALERLAANSVALNTEKALPEEVRRRLARVEGAAGDGGPQEMLGQFLSAMQGAGGVPAAPATPASRAGRHKAWAGDTAQPAGAEVLTPTPAASDLLLYQGTVIPCVLTRRINSDLPGPITARVSMNVYDSRTSRKLLLPMGALLVGAYSSDVHEGQERLQFAFTRLRMPDGSTYDLPGATGSDSAGQSGAPGQVDRHFARRFGSALLLGLLADRVTKIAALPRGGAADPGGLSATGQVFVDTARAELERHQAIPPTITVEEGARLNVEVVRDIDFPRIYGASE